MDGVSPSPAYGRGTAVARPVVLKGAIAPPRVARPCRRGASTLARREPPAALVRPAADSPTAERAEKRLTGGGVREEGPSHAGAGGHRPWTTRRRPARASAGGAVGVVAEDGRDCGPSGAEKRRHAAFVG
ncbi:hypothetical protein GCM10010358_32680 [Streptomyces minutiscleroticus]|uniref:Uncharacterized protein n=1 Tax=Streptomyces minutiscleroticus TaxID=68238 RepID=A0A918NKP4_9ACTN|nr:hypothetical protein GCM10010358_32680 [Streptomyces minutiscleroticus]